MAKIVLELETSEALMILDPIQDKALRASKLAAESTGDVHEIADLAAVICGRVATAIVDALYPPGSIAEMRHENRREEARLGIA